MKTTNDIVKIVDEGGELKDKRNCNPSIINPLFAIFEPLFNKTSRTSTQSARNDIEKLAIG